MKKILIILIIALALALATFACDDGNNTETHTHEWGAWQYNATEHWKECTANDGAEYGRANHTGDPCTVCDYETPKPHESTITAYGRTITVKGDTSISTADFNTAKGKLEQAMVYLDENMNDQVSRNEYAVMLDRTGFAMIIETGNASPNANDNKQMTVGVVYLIANDVVPTIAMAIDDKVYDGAFAD